MKYDDAGVNIERAKRAKEAIRKHVKSTWSREVLSDLGAFGGLFELSGKYKEPVLVSSIDGVGTKLLVAAAARRYNTIGRDLVNHCVNDILVQGAKPLFFLDYIASGSLDPAVVESVVEGLSVACRANRCALVGGETAEMPGMYGEGEFDLAGCIVGVVEKKKIIDGRKIREGDLVFSLPSNGLHTNGYSLARKILFEKAKLKVDDPIPGLGFQVGDELLKVHVSYLEPVERMMERVEIKGLAHITGGGVVENLPRILPAGCDAVIRRGSWAIPPVFRFLQEVGEVDDAEMYRVFNMGLGMLIVTGKADRERVSAAGGRPGASLVGEIVGGKGRVRIE